MCLKEIAKIAPANEDGCAFATLLTKNTSGVKKTCEQLAFLKLKELVLRIKRYSLSASDYKKQTKGMGATTGEWNKSKNKV